MKKSVRGEEEIPYIDLPAEAPDESAQVPRLHRGVPFPGEDAVADPDKLRARKARMNALGEIEKDKWALLRHESSDGGEKDRFRGDTELRALSVANAGTFAQIV